MSWRRWISFIAFCFCFWSSQIHYFQDICSKIYVHLYFSRVLIVSRNLQVISECHFHFHVSGLVSGENNKVSLTLSLSPCLINCPFLFPEPLGLHSSRLSDTPLGSFHPSSSRLSDELHSLSFGSSQMWSAKLPCSRKKLEYEQTETQSEVVGKRKV